MIIQYFIGKKQKKKEKSQKKCMQLAVVEVFFFFCHHLAPHRIYLAKPQRGPNILRVATLSVKKEAVLTWHADINPHVKASTKTESHLKCKGLSPYYTHDHQFTYHKEFDSACEIAA